MMAEKTSTGLLKQCGDADQGQGGGHGSVI
jgi:hypothetical protein